MLLKTLTEAFGVPGQEQEIANVIRELVSPYCDSVETDALGNLIAIKTATKRSQSHAHRPHGRGRINGHVH